MEILYGEWSEFCHVFFSLGSKTVNDVNKLEVEFLASIVSTRLYFKLHPFPFCFGFLFFQFVAIFRVYHSKYNRIKLTVRWKDNICILSQS